jgi:DNA-binding MarR family transcriptional regulator
LKASLSSFAFADEIISLELRRVQLEMSRRLEELFLNHNVRHTHFSIFQIIERSPGTPQVVLAEKLLLKSSQITNILFQMEQRAWITRLPGAMDRRAKSVFLTEKGQVLLQELKLLAINNEAEMCNALTGDEKYLLLSLLKKCIKNAEICGR